MINHSQPRDSAGVAKLMALTVSDRVVRLAYRNSMEPRAVSMDRVNTTVPVVSVSVLCGRDILNCSVVRNPVAAITGTLIIVASVETRMWQLISVCVFRSSVLAMLLWSSVPILNRWATHALEKAAMAASVTPSRVGDIPCVGDVGLLSSDRITSAAPVADAVSSVHSHMLAIRYLGCVVESWRCRRNTKPSVNAPVYMIVVMVVCM